MDRRRDARRSGKISAADRKIDAVATDTVAATVISQRMAGAGAGKRHRILGIDFFDGTAQQAIAIMRRGGLLVVPAAPALVALESNADYREALLQADLAITDSALMVLIWNQLQRDPIRRLSGLKYLRELLHEPDVREPGNTLWIMASPESARRNLDWLRSQKIVVPEDCLYMAPMYGGRAISDTALLERLDRLQPQHVVVTLGGGTQERLGLYLKQHLNYRPAIHCIGAAIAFLSGDQVHIPVWADRLYLGWLFRSLSEPRRYIPRYWEARRLLALMRRYRDRLPDLKE